MSRSVLRPLLSALLLLSLFVMVSSPGPAEPAAERPYEVWRSISPTPAPMVAGASSSIRGLSSAATMPQM